MSASALPCAPGLALKVPEADDRRALCKQPPLRRPHQPGRLFLFVLLSAMATTFHYRCPNTEQAVQGWSADDATDDGDEYQSVACLACAQVHLVNLKTGKVLGVTED